MRGHRRRLQLPNSPNLPALFQYSQQADDRLRVLNAAVIDHLKSSRAADDFDLNGFVFVRMDRCLFEIASLVKIHELRCKSGCGPETRPLDHPSRAISCFFFQYPDCTSERIFTFVERAGGNLN